MKTKLTEKQRFFAKVALPNENGCMLWTGGKVMDGYGVFGSKSMRAHRWAWTYWNGAIPDGMRVCHHCDRPACCTPDHLFLGTDADNHRDRDEKGRGPRGPANGMAKLTEEDIPGIRMRYADGNVTLLDLAEEFGVDQALIHRIIHRKSWRRVA